MKKLWCSGATDTTGAALAAALGFEMVKTMPRLNNLNNLHHIVIGWGTKTTENINFGQNVTVMNHPNAIRANRNKYGALGMFANDRIMGNNIAKFCAANEIISKLEARRDKMELPVVGRKNYHQSGKDFWLCLTKDHVNQAIAAGAQYFQEYSDIKDEYRLHVMFGDIIYAVKKVANPSVENWVEQRKEKVQTYAVKNNINLEEATLDYTLKIMGKEAVLPDHIVRSNKRGWKFSGVRLNSISENLREAAIRAVEVMGLDFGAVDCIKTNDAKSLVLEINSGPGLQGTALERYIEAFRNKIAEIDHRNRGNEEAPVRQPRQRARAVNAAANDDNAGGGLAMVMRNVRNDDEARAVIDELMVRRG